MGGGVLYADYFTSFGQPKHVLFLLMIFLVYSDGTQSTVTNKHIALIT